MNEPESSTELPFDPEYVEECNRRCFKLIVAVEQGDGPGAKAAAADLRAMLSAPDGPPARLGMTTAELGDVPPPERDGAGVALEDVRLTVLGPAARPRPETLSEAAARLRAARKGAGLGARCRGSDELEGVLGITRPLRSSEN
ncbi:MAG TPA: hypothetical protein VD838_01475 [Anaeromyxobacteraceae bacterium]|nr:hypothetical protein [Anaeromyxobacteraceae bacterium]